GGKFRSERPRDPPNGSSERKWIFPLSSASSGSRHVWIFRASSARGSGRGIWIFPTSSAGCCPSCSIDPGVVIQADSDHRKAAGGFSDFHRQNCRTRKSQI